MADVENEGVARFLATLTHELKTPLHSILAISHLLMAEQDGPLNDEQKRQVAIISRNGERLLDMIRELLLYGSLQDETRPLKVKQFSPAELFETELLSAKPLAEKNGVGLTWNISGLPATFCSDPLLLRHTLTNLLTNAIKFSPAGEKVEVFAASAAGGVLTFQIVDAGVGIPRELHQAVFGEFFQAESKDSRRFEGVGLGLALVKRCITKLKGRIELKSESGHGTLFTVSLPGLESELVRSKVLVVERDESIVLSLSRFLQHENIDVTCVAGPADGQRVVTSFSPNVILLDSDHDSAGSQEFLTHLRETPGGREIAVILMSALDNPGERARYFELGADDFIGKPFDMAELRARINLHLERRTT